jgi:hypothetical protein
MDVPTHFTQTYPPKQVHSRLFTGGCGKNFLGFGEKSPCRKRFTKTLREKKSQIFVVAFFWGVS